MTNIPRAGKTLRYTRATTDDTLPFNVQECTDKFIRNILASTRYRQWQQQIEQEKLGNYNTPKVDILEARLFTEITEENRRRVSYGNTSSNVSSVSTQEETSNLGMDRERKDN